MTLISLKFLIFVAVSSLVYFIFPKRFRWTVLLAASYFYYIFNCNEYVIYMLVTTITTFFGALAIERMAERASFKLKSHKEDWSKGRRKTYKKKALTKKKLVLGLILVLNFGILSFLKYFGLLADTFVNVLDSFGVSMSSPEVNLILPLGISFYTFQAMGYIIDVYRSKVPAEKNIAKFALFVSFFPQIIQGPIAFYSDLAHQLYEPHNFSYKNFKNGGLLIIWGIFKKIVIADRAVKVISLVTKDYDSFSGTYIVITVLIYAIQLYADFSGGIDICRGIAEILGINMAENFRRPYFSKDLTEYWHRWHITLGAWLRNYLFYPISISKAFLNIGKKIKKKNVFIGKILPTCIASLITFLVIGIWHGANWKYVAFGFWNGFMIMLAELFKPWLDKLTKFLHIKKESFLYGVFAMLRTFILVLIGYYMDIAEDFTAAIKMISLSVTDFRISDLKDFSCLAPSTLDEWDYLIIIAGAVIIFIVSVIQEKSGKTIRDLLSKRAFPIQWTLYLFLIFAIIIFGYYGPGTDPADFIYMQF